MMRVCAEPTMMQVAISACAVETVDKGVTATCSSGRPIARPKITGVVDGRQLQNVSKARSSCHGRARETGLYRATTKPVLAAASRRRSMTGQGLRLSESETAQK